MPHLENLNEKQKEAVKIIQGAVLVIAGAGSGKTRVVTARVIHLIASGVSPHQILGLTFTNKAAQEMKERVKKLTNADVIISTFHSLGAKILRESIHHLGYTRNFVIYDEDDAQKLLKQVLEKFGIKDKKSDFKNWKNLISKAKNNLAAPDLLDVSCLTETSQSLFPEVYASYLEQLKASNAVDFDDLLYLPVRLFQEHPLVLDRYQQRWQYLLIDEYQDTNAAQYAFVKLLVEQSQNIFVVGDPDQAIYSWRGANIQNILNFERDYPGAQIIRLEQNYRSHCNILKAANALITHNVNRYEKKLWSHQEHGPKITLFSAYDEREEARFVSSRIWLHHRNEKISFNDIVIFYRTNAQSRPFEDQLLSLKIPYVIIGGISFYQRKEIKDILAFLRVIYSEADISAFLRTINIPKRGVGEATVSKLLNAALAEKLPILVYCEHLLNQEPLNHTVKLSEKIKQGLREYLNLKNDLKPLITQVPLKDLVTAVIEKSGYLGYLREEKETFEERKSNLDELIAKAVEWDLSHDNQADLGEFLEELSLKSNLDESTPMHERIHLMTIHNGKGLEFTLSFMVGLEEDLFPHVNSRGSEEAIEEERRLCYVGMTRAKKYLYLTRSEVRYLWGTQRFQRPSRFLKEIPIEYYEKVRS